MYWKRRQLYTAVASRLRVGIVLGLSVVLALIPLAAGAQQDYSPAYEVKDTPGEYFHVLAMVDNTAYSDHIYANSFWLNVYTDNTTYSAVCSEYPWTRNSPVPYSANPWNDGSPFPISTNPTWDYHVFNDDMYWGSGAVRIFLLTDSQDYCGSFLGPTGAGVIMYRTGNGWNITSKSN